MVSAAPIGSAKARVAVIGSGARRGVIGSARRPKAWSSLRPGSGPKRRARGARG